MTHRANPTTELPSGFVPADEIDISSWGGSRLVADVAGNIRCYVGYIAPNQPSDLPYYAPSVALRYKDGMSSSRFVELRRGMLERSSFLYGDSYFQVLDDRWLILPSGADGYFGVVDRKSREEDVERTRELFGGTRHDIEGAAKALSKAIGRGYHELVQLPRVTFSKTRDNSCDVSGCLIPKNFPYLAFEDSQRDWSHVSLHAFYRLLSLVCPRQQGSSVQRAILDDGVSEDVLNILLKAAEQYGSPLPYREAS